MRKNGDGWFRVDMHGFDTGVDANGTPSPATLSVRSTRPGFQPEPDPAPAPGHAAPDTAWGLVPPTPDEVNLTVAPWFDAAHYHAANADVQGSGMDPLQHFVLHGAAELRNPNRWFDMHFYVMSNADVQSMAFNGFWHYLVQGRAQGRAPRRSRGAERQAMLQARPPLERDPPRPPQPMACLAYASLRHALQSRLPGAAGVSVSVSHDRYTRNIGGVQILVSDEQLAFNARGEAYLHIAPAVPRLTLAPEGASPFYVHATLDGAYVGVTTYADLAHALAELRPHLPIPRRLILHCLLGHQVMPLVALHAALAPPDAVFWVNDYESICIGYNLLRNDAVFCGAPPPGSGGCRVCVYGEEREEHLRQVRLLFEAVPLRVVAPSAAALAVWQRGASLPHVSAQVHEYAEIEYAGAEQAVIEHGAEPAADPTDDDPAIRVAFIGYPAAHKGWPAFAEVVARIGGTPEYRLFHFAAYPPAQPLPGVELVPARVLPGARGAMTAALQAHRIDLALVLSPWPETFCLVAYEAMAAGADVVALADGGNVADAVLQTGRGVVMDDVEAVIRFFLSGAAVCYARLCAEGPRHTGRLVSRGMTATLPGAA